ncbi:MAG: PspC domain-containing protein [Thermoleophilaceae bacterium]|jgi:phage shock protein PspC (stress-responsive transcriptional regulator)|nr:PspC domain-containing protein [Thermoleophilaceae bacterium]
MSDSPDSPHVGPAEASRTGPPQSDRAEEGQLARFHAKVRRQRLVRPQGGRLLAGVLAGLARRVGISPWAARAIFLLSLLLPGPQFLAYGVLWIVMPNER